jgi:cytochrome c biogenesis protein CcdA/thiol-disulfide isomerase/thioredoxin
LVFIVLAYIGGVLTIASPCVLPVLPFVFSSADRPFIRSGLPLLAGMTLTFGAISTLAAVGGGWAVHANEFGRTAALALMTFFALTLLFGSLGDRVMRPIVSLGSWLSRLAGSEEGASVGTALLLGVATGLVWAPCAGPILGLILTGASIKGATLGTTVLLLAYATGAATSLAAALLIGGRLLAALKQSLGAGEWVRRALGIAVLAGVAAIAFGADRGILARLSIASTAGVEQMLVTKAGYAQSATLPKAAGSVLPVEGLMPSLSGAVAWLNSPPLSTYQVRGKVVLIDFWTYSCINCLRTLPYIRAWDEKYRKYGLVVIGVHSPEFAFEKELRNVRQAVHESEITYPVVVDSNLAIWQSGKHSTMNIGPRTISSMKKVESGTTISMKANTTNPNGSFRPCWPKQDRVMSLFIGVSLIHKLAVYRPPPALRICSHRKPILAMHALIILFPDLSRKTRRSCMNSRWSLIPTNGA